MDIIWDGIQQSRSLNSEEQTIRQRLADAAKSYQWPHVLALLAEHPGLINTTRPDGVSLYAPLHQAAHGGAPVEAVEQLLELGAWCTLQNARGERAIDVAESQGQEHLVSLLLPHYNHHVPLGILLKIQQHFHEVIRCRVRDLVDGQGLRLPELEPLLELEEPKMWFAVPGMYGVFHYWLETPGVNTKLITESWCRVAGGSGQRHEITSSGSNLVNEGFV